MAAETAELQELLVKYIDSYAGKEILREKLMNTPVQLRYSTLATTKGWSEWTAVHRATEGNDIEMMECMLSQLLSEQQFNLLLIQDVERSTSVHRVASDGYTDLTIYMLSNLTNQQRFQILKVPDINGDTALHDAALKKHTDMLRILLTSVTPYQQRELLRIKNNNKKSVRKLVPIPDLTYGYFMAGELVLLKKEHKLSINAFQLELTSQATESNSQIELLKEEVKEANRRIKELETKVKQQSELWLKR